MSEPSCAGRGSSNAPCERGQLGVELGLPLGKGVERSCTTGGREHIWIAFDAWLGLDDIESQLWQPEPPSVPFLPRFGSDGPHAVSDVVPPKVAIFSFRWAVRSANFTRAPNVEPSSHACHTARSSSSSRTRLRARSAAFTRFMLRAIGLT